MLHARMLTYLDEVVRCGSIRQAAERLHVAPSSINRQILALEEEYGAPLFERMHRRLRLTAVGELVITHVRQTLAEHGRLQTRISELHGRRRGVVRIATMVGLATAVLPPVIDALQRRNPFIKLIVQALSLPGNIDALESGAADIGFAFNLPDDPKLRLVASAQMQIGAVVAPTHPLAAKQAVHLSECVGFPLVLPDRSLTIGRIIAEAFEKSSIATDLAMESNSVDLIKQVVLRGEWITIVNHVDAEPERSRGDLVFLPLLDDHVGRHVLKLVHRARGTLDAAQSLVLEELRDLTFAIGRSGPQGQAGGQLAPRPENAIL